MGSGFYYPLREGLEGTAKTPRLDDEQLRATLAGSRRPEALAGDRVHVARHPRGAHGAQARMRLAHVRERHAPAGSAWRLAAALDGDGSTWLDLEVARRRAVAANRTLEHDFALFRRPVTTLDDHLAAGLRVAALGDLVDGFARACRRR